MLSFQHLVLLFRIKRNRKSNANFVKYNERVELYLTLFVFFFFYNVILHLKVNDRKRLEAWKNPFDSPSLLCKHCFIKPGEPMGLTQGTFISSERAMQAQTEFDKTLGAIFKFNRNTWCSDLIDRIFCTKKALWKQMQSLM